MAAVQGASRSERSPPGHRFETGTQPHELLAGFVAAVEYVESVGWDAIQTHERSLGERFLDGLPDAVHAARPADDGRPRRNVQRSRTRRARRVRSPRRSARTASPSVFFWHGDYYAVELMRLLELGENGAVRAGIVHYNTEAEVDRLIEELDRLA